MRILKLRREQTAQIGPDVTVQVLEVNEHWGWVKLGIVAAEGVQIERAAHASLESEKSVVTKDVTELVPITLMGYRCSRCGHEWVPMKAASGPPRVCPSCKSPYWDRPRKFSL